VLKNFDGVVYAFARVGDALYAATSQGLLRSVSSGVTWSVVSPIPISEVRFIAAEKETLVAASLNALTMSVDGGKTWQTATLPDKVRQVSALAVDGRGDVWVGDKDGVYFSGAKGGNWQPLTDLVVRRVNNLYFDEAANRMLVTANEPVTEAFSVAIPSLRVTSWDTGWNLRFVRPVGDHLVGVTLFDGIVVQPRMVDSAEITAP
jgi:photosystem II stability/assembly factor-like uncharacterized protein